MTPRILLALASCLVAYAADDLLKTTRGSAPEKVLARPDVAELPFGARDQLLLKVSPAYAALPPAEAFRMLRHHESEYSASRRVKPLQDFIWYQGCEVCGRFLKDGREYLTVQYGPLYVSITAGSFEKYVDAWIYTELAKDANLTVDILSKDISFAQTGPKIIQTERAAIKEVAKAVQHGANWKAALVAGLGGMATRTVTVEQDGVTNGSYRGTNGSGTFSGTYSSTATIYVPDLEARASAQQRAVDLKSQAQARSAGVFNTALLDTTIRPGESLGGYVYFKMDKGMESGILQLRIGTVSIEFPLAWR